MVVATGIGVFVGGGGGVPCGVAVGVRVRVGVGPAGVTVTVRWLSKLLAVVSYLSDLKCVANQATALMCSTTPPGTACVASQLTRGASNVAYVLYQDVAHAAPVVTAVGVAVGRPVGVGVAVGVRGPGVGLGVL